jgi:hypothetical protein
MPLLMGMNRPVTIYNLVLNGIIKPNTMGFRGAFNGELKALVLLWLN